MVIIALIILFAYLSFENTKDMRVQWTLLGLGSLYMLWGFVALQFIATIGIIPPIRKAKLANDAYHEYPEYF
jgi:hypothetical protein